MITNYIDKIKSVVDDYQENATKKRSLLSGPFGFPLHLNIETSNRCNLDCIMCPRRDMERKVGNMTFETFKQIIDESSKHGLESIWLHVLGEPLLNPQVFNFIRYAKRYPNLKNIGFSTNCSYMDDHRAKETLLSGLDRIILSLDGMKKETYETIRQRGDFEKVTENIRNFLVLRKHLRPDLKLELSIINLKLTKPEIAAYQEYWRPYLLSDKELIIKPFVNFGGLVNDELNAEYQQKQGFTFSKPCNFLWKSLTVLWNGDVTVCCFDGNHPLMKVGSVKESSLQDIWLGEQQNHYRKQHLTLNFSKLSLCKSCSENHITLHMPFMK